MPNKTLDQETVSFLETLTPQQTRKLLNTPMFVGVVLKAVADSETVSKNVEAVLDAKFDEMSPEEKERITRLADRIAAKLTGKKTDG